MKPFAIRDRTGGTVARFDLASAAKVDLRRSTRGAGFIVTNPEGEILEIHPATSESDERKHRRRAEKGEYRDPQQAPAPTSQPDPVQLITDDEVPVTAKAVACVRREAEIEDEDDEAGEALDEHLSGVLASVEQLSESDITKGNTAIEALLEHHKVPQPSPDAHPRPSAHAAPQHTEEGPTAQEMVDQAVSEIFGEPVVEQLAAEPSRANVLAAAIEKAGGVPQLAAVIGVHNTTIYKARGGAGVSDLLLAQCGRYLARKKPGPKPRAVRETPTLSAPTVASGDLEGQLLTLLQPLIDARAQQLAEELAHKLVERAVAEHPDVRRARKILDAVKAVA